ncbi:hypothetical protein [Alicyclobacillus sp. ALC3]|uniref:hypothetical protein n=1 Tax=Alicyclobacillus sp. ALC3 TaxID=2796143 RepID=UPI002379D7F1|nr:hypothetical protein [Alicyclobacillus sp. ALC3]WDL96928.1 hypothetical protein JC200_22060 [Alicyclobacillus sp. ALC3]
MYAVRNAGPQVSLRYMRPGWRALAMTSKSTTKRMMTMFAKDEDNRLDFLLHYLGLLRDLNKDGVFVTSEIVATMAVINTQLGIEVKAPKSTPGAVTRG